LHFDTHFLTSKKKCRWVGGNGMKLLDFSFFSFFFSFFSGRGRRGRRDLREEQREVEA
jgi:hypothetical protein